LTLTTRIDAPETFRNYKEAGKSGSLRDLIGNVAALDISNIVLKGPPQDIYLGGVCHSSVFKARVPS